MNIFLSQFKGVLCLSYVGDLDFSEEIQNLTKKMMQESQQPLKKPVQTRYIFCL